MPRFSLLEHTGAPDDPAGRHFDLLVEDGEHCRTWRLSDLPRPDGQPVTAVEIATHRLAWLDHVDGPVSGGRGRARRIDAGSCRLESARDVAGHEIVVEIAIGSGEKAAILRLSNGTCAATPGHSGKPQ